MASALPLAAVEMAQGELAHRRTARRHEQRKAAEGNRGEAQRPEKFAPRVHGHVAFQISVSSALNDVRDRELTLAELETVAGVIPAPDVYMPTAATAAVLRVPLAASWGWCG
jgi:hypothetical protein